MGDPKSTKRPGTAVLVVEDNSLIALDLETILLNCGVEHVQIASSIRQALAFIEAEPFDAAFLDLRVSETVTLDVAAALQRAGTPFAFATGYDADSAVLAGFRTQPVIAKPYAECEICDVLDQLLHKGREGTQESALGRKA